MKPIRLELKEFGPYKHEIVEWDKIINEPIFLITGKTGSGKSTLFDAFVYALYNKTTSGKDIASLRTKTADDKTRTTVIFDFELKNICIYLFEFKSISLFCDLKPLFKRSLCQSI